MRKNIRIQAATILRIEAMSKYLMVLTLLLGFSACNNEDDVMEIFNNKTWKLSRLTTEGSKEPFYQGLWSSEAEEKTSRDLLGTEGNFILNFNCAEVNGEVTGTADAHAVRSNISNATLHIDGKKKTIRIGGKVVGTESDKLAKAFNNGLLNVFRYDGDAHQLTLYFKDGNTTKVMGFTAH